MSTDWKAIAHSLHWVITSGTPVDSSQSQAILAKYDDAVLYDVPCEATIWHGPGHQSSTKCQVRGRHLDHFARYGAFNDEMTWQGDEVFD